VPARPQQREQPRPRPRSKSATEIERERDLRLVNGSILTTSSGSTWPYSKVRLVPYGEVVPFRGMITFLRFPWNFGGRDLNAGSELKPMEWRGHKIGALICFDNVFNFIPLTEARAGAQYLVLMTNNSWYPMRSGIRQHADIDVLRAIETRRPLLRCSTTGWSQLVDRSGRIVKSTQQRVGVPETLQVATQPGSGNTVYMRTGDLFAQFCLLLALIIAVPPVIAGRSEGFL
jgi:apolipoprotein N-acyltransferase